MNDTTAEGSPIREALEREHQVVDRGIEEFRAAPGDDTLPLLRTALVALRRHIWLEEELLFPPLREAGLFGPVMVMLLEHGEIWRAMDEMEGALADGDTERQQTSCTTLLQLLDQHNRKEEPIVYPQADVALSEDARAQLEDFIAHEQLPTGWVCQRA